MPWNAWRFAYRSNDSGPTKRRDRFRVLFVFEPVESVTRVVYIATPHRGSTLANRGIGRLGSALVERPQDSREMICQIDRDNPGIVTPLAKELPSSIDLLLSKNAVLETMEWLPRAPWVVEHTVAGVAHRSLHGGDQGDFVVPIESASIDGVAGEWHVPATHINIFSRPETIHAVRVILSEYEARVPAQPMPGLGTEPS